PFCFSLLLSACSVVNSNANLCDRGVPGGTCGAGGAGAPAARLACGRRGDACSRRESIACSGGSAGRDPSISAGLDGGGAGRSAGGPGRCARRGKRGRLADGAAATWRTCAAGSCGAGRTSCACGTGGNAAAGWGGAFG